MYFRCSCSVFHPDNCRVCPVTQNKGSIHDFINSRVSESPDKNKKNEETGKALKNAMESLKGVSQLISLANFPGMAGFPLPPEREIPDLIKNILGTTQEGRTFDIGNVVIGGIIHTPKGKGTNQKPEEAKPEPEQKETEKPATKKAEPTPEPKPEQKLLYDYDVTLHNEHIATVKAYRCIRGPTEFWFLSETGEIKTKMSLKCQVLRQD